jgi:hypothetical protein
VNPSTLKDIERILKMSEQSLIQTHPNDRALIRAFGRETRKVARGYTSQHINTLNTASSKMNTRQAPSKSLKGRTLKNKNNVVESLENANSSGPLENSSGPLENSPVPYADSSGRFENTNVGPPAYNA